MNAMVDSAAFYPPLFKTPRGALLFAFNFAHGSVKKGFLASLVGGARPGRGLGGLDGAAQAGLIKAEILKLGDVPSNVITARFCPPKTPCTCRAPCCVGYRLNRDWATAIDWLSKHIHVAAQLGTISHYHLRRALVARYFGQEVSFKAIAAKCGVNRDTASDQNRKAVAYLSEQEDRAMAGAAGALEAAGVVGS